MYIINLLHACGKYTRTNMEMMTVLESILRFRFVTWDGRRDGISEGAAVGALLGIGLGANDGDCVGARQAAACIVICTYEQQICLGLFLTVK